ncbi:hypothetical protein TSUD_155470 [Trifolium subterraneum]|uniref:AT-hook motif nuclear-localized protein n=1 Tax=Trifolium subterraneum TaxID=3900 RepID=A0A2Z6MTS1_TRISU|nr:hypothetical protein TSUD_155470 [Trifolium subterraneum]
MIDVAEKIKIFAKQNEFVWIAGAIGSLYEAEIGQEQKDLILQGDYDIINLGGLFTAPKNGNPMTGQLSITIAAAGIGRVYGGAVLGPLIAQSVVQIITAFIWNSVEDGSEEQDNDI